MMILWMWYVFYDDSIRNETLQNQEKYEKIRGAVESRSAKLL